MIQIFLIAIGGLFNVRYHYLDSKGEYDPFPSDTGCSNSQASTITFSSSFSLVQVLWLPGSGSELNSLLSLSLNSAEATGALRRRGADHWRGLPLVLGSQASQMLLRDAGKRRTSGSSHLCHLLRWDIPQSLQSTALGRTDGCAEGKQVSNHLCACHQHLRGEHPTPTPIQPPHGPSAYVCGLISMPLTHRKNR